MYHMGTGHTGRTGRSVQVLGIWEKRSFSTYFVYPGVTLPSPCEANTPLWPRHWDSTTTPDRVVVASQQQKALLLEPIS